MYVAAIRSHHSQVPFVKSLVLNNDVIELLAARVTNAWERQPSAADRFFERNEMAIVQQSSAPDGVVCVFADLAYLRAFGADLLRSFGEAHRRSQIGLHVHLPDHRRRSR